jgi:hypothetical protein
MGCTVKSLKLSIKLKFLNSLKTGPPTVTRFTLQTWCSSVLTHFTLISLFWKNKRTLIKVTLLSLCASLPITASQWLGKHIPTAMNTHATIGELFPPLIYMFSMQSVSYQVGLWDHPAVCVSAAFPSNFFHFLCNPLEPKETRWLVLPRISCLLMCLILCWLKLWLWSSIVISGVGWWVNENCHPLMHSNATGVLHTKAGEHNTNWTTSQQDVAIQSSIMSCDR